MIWNTPFCFSTFKDSESKFFLIKSFSNIFFRGIFFCAANASFKLKIFPTIDTKTFFSRRSYMAWKKTSKNHTWFFWMIFLWTIQTTYSTSQWSQNQLSLFLHRSHKNLIWLLIPNITFPNLTDLFLFDTLKSSLFQIP